jgi:hypothetical protein
MKRIITIACFLFVLSACSAKSAQVPENFQTISQPMAENLFSSIQANDFENFHKDFNEKMLSSTDETTFTSIRDSFLQTVGDYQSLTYDKTTYEEGYLISYYAVQFSEGSLTMRLVHDPAEPYLISGFWFPDFPSQ